MTSPAPHADRPASDPSRPPSRRVSPGLDPAGEAPSPRGRIGEDRYPRPLQILHWLVVALVAVQVVSSEAMEAWFDGPRAADAGAAFSTGALIHAVTGTGILLLMAARLLMRFSYGTPPSPGDLPKPVRILAWVNHFAFYVLLFALPITGIVAANFVPGIAGAHGLLTRALYAVLALHVAAVLWHMLVLRDGLLWRMIGR